MTKGQASGSYLGPHHATTGATSPSVDVQSVPRFNASPIRDNVRNTVAKKCLFPVPPDDVEVP
jgi:hypothetical protein